MSATIVIGDFATDVVKANPNDVWGFARESGLADRIKTAGLRLAVRGATSLSDMREAENLYKTLTGKKIDMKIGHCLFVLTRVVETADVDHQDLATFAGEITKRFHLEEVKA